MKEHLKEVGGDYPDSILGFLQTTDHPVDVEKIRKHCGIGNWNTCLKHCLELLLSGKLNGQKTTKSWVFWGENRCNKIGVNK